MARHLDGQRNLQKDSYLRFVSAALAASDDCIKIIGLDGSLQYMSEGGQRVMEVDDFAALKGCPWPDFWQDQGNADAVAAIEAARLGKTARFTGYANTAKGNRRYWDVKVSPIIADDGSVEAILSVSRDVTSLKDGEEQQALLRGELSHRIKNILALVQSVAMQTLGEDDDMAVAKPAFLARLNALSQAHDLLVQSSQASTTLMAVARTVANDQFAHRIRATGPLVHLSARTGLAIALTLHELATNAVKYGALSSNDGRVDFVWDVTGEAAEKRVNLSWTESGGPPVVAPTRKGFGSRMIERALAQYVRGSVDVSYLPSGLSFTMSALLEDLATE